MLKALPGEASGRFVGAALQDADGTQKGLAQVPVLKGIRQGFAW